jgi:hypothetical protein
VQYYHVERHGSSLKESGGKSNTLTQSIKILPICSAAGDWGVTVYMWKLKATEEPPAGAENNGDGTYTFPLKGLRTSTIEDRDDVIIFYNHDTPQHTIYREHRQYVDNFIDAIRIKHFSWDGDMNTITPEMRAVHMFDGEVRV